MSHYKKVNKWKKQRTSLMECLKLIKQSRREGNLTTSEYFSAKKTLCLIDKKLENKIQIVKPSPPSQFFKLGEKVLLVTNLQKGEVVACVDNNRILVKFEGDDQLLTNGGDRIEYSCSFDQQGRHVDYGEVLIKKVAINDSMVG